MIFDPEQEDSTKAALLAPHLDALRDREWRMAYTNSSATGVARTARVSSEGLSGTRSKAYRTHLGWVSTIDDVERMAMALALEREHGLVAIVSHSKAAIATLFRLGEDGAHRYGIEVRMK